MSYNKQHNNSKGQGNPVDSNENYEKENNGSYFFLLKQADDNNCLDEYYEREYKKLEDKIGELIKSIKNEKQEIDIDAIKFRLKKLETEYVEYQAKKSCKNCFTDLSDFLILNPDLLNYCPKCGIKLLKREIVEFGRYPYEEDGTIKPIEWIVLEKYKDGTALLLSKFGIEAKEYDEEQDNYSWEKCTLRKWLNSDFYNMAFNAEEQKKIIVSNVVNGDNNPKYTTDGGKNTKDKVFILTFQDMLTFFNSNEARDTSPTPYALEKGAYIDESGDGAPGIIWLRSPGANDSFVGCVAEGGFLDYFGAPGDIYNAVVRPAIRINIDNL